jgi:hypothetical protein
MNRLIVASLFLAALCAAASAQVSMTGTGLGAPSTGGGGGGQSVWNSADKDTSITLSTTALTNDTATQNGAGSSWRMVRGTQGYATGTANKKVFTLAMAAVDSTRGWLGGVADASVTLGSYVGSAAHAMGVQAAATVDYQDGVVQSPQVCSGSFAQGSTLWIAIDFNTGNLWCSADCTTWLGSGTPNPDSGTNPAYALTSATYFPAWSGDDNTGSDVAVLNTRPTLGGCSNITTFSQWG